MMNFVTQMMLVVLAQAGVEHPNVVVASDIQLEFWGRAVFNAHYDDAEMRGLIDFATYVTQADSSEFNFNPRDTRLGFSARHQSGAWTTKAVMELDFYGDNSGNNLEPRLRLGYAQADNGSYRVLAGQDWLPIARQNPGMIDFGILAWGGNLWWRVPQITVERHQGAYTLSGSLFKHRISNAQERAETMPWLAGRLAWQRESRLIALGIGYRSVDVNGVDDDPYLVALETALPLSENIKLTGELWLGKGIGREFIRYDLDYNAATGQAMSARGGFLDLSWKPGPKWSLNAGVGLDDPDDDDLLDVDGQPIAAAFQRNQVCYLTLRRHLNKHFGSGLEAIHLRTKGLDGQTQSGLRTTWSMWFTF